MWVCVIRSAAYLKRQTQSHPPVCVRQSQRLVRGPSAKRFGPQERAVDRGWGSRPLPHSFHICESDVPRRRRIASQNLFVYSCRGCGCWLAESEPVCRRRRFYLRGWVRLPDWLKKIHSSCVGTGQCRAHRPIADAARDGHDRARPSRGRRAMGTRGRGHRGAGVRWACAGAAIADSVHDECVPARRRAPDRDIADIHITKCITPPAQSAGTVHARYSTRITLTSLSGKGIRPT